MRSGQYTPVHHVDGPVNDVAPGSWLDRGLDHIEGDERNLREARKVLWNAMAERSGAPIIERPHLGHRAVTQARKTITADSDVVAMVDSWHDGALGAEQEKALFAPWGDIDEAKRADVARILSATPDYAYGIWDSAMRAATPTRPPPP